MMSMTNTTETNTQRKTEHFPTRETSILHERGGLARIFTLSREILMGVRKHRVGVVGVFHVLELETPGVSATKIKQGQMECGIIFSSPLSCDTFSVHLFVFPIMVQHLRSIYRMVFLQVWRVRKNQKSLLRCDRPPSRCLVF